MPDERCITPDHAVWKERLTGADLYTAHQWHVAGTDLGIPYYIDRYQSIAYLFGDTFDTPWPEQPNNDWRSPVMLRCNRHPNDGIVFDSAACVAGNGRAPELVPNGHFGDAGYGTEVTVIPNDGFTCGETHYMSYMSIESWQVPNAQWKSSYAGIAVSHDGNTFTRTEYRNWNTPANDDPYQMWSMQKEGDYVYIISVRAGRQNGPMMLRRSKIATLLNGDTHELWDGHSWGRNSCRAIIDGEICEPSLRKLENTWVMSYLTHGNIVTRTAPRPEGPWSAEKTQVTYAQEPGLYGGFIHPWSTTKPNDLHLMVSKWAFDSQGASTAYHVSRYQGST